MPTDNQNTVQYMPHFRFLSQVFQMEHPGPQDLTSVTHSIYRLLQLSYTVQAAAGSIPSVIHTADSSCSIPSVIHSADSSCSIPFAIHSADSSCSISFVVHSAYSSCSIPSAIHSADRGCNCPPASPLPNHIVSHSQEFCNH